MDITSRPECCNLPPVLNHAWNTFHSGSALPQDGSASFLRLQQNLHPAYLHTQLTSLIIMQTALPDSTPSMKFRSGSIPTFRQRYAKRSMLFGHSKSKVKQYLTKGDVVDLWPKVSTAVHRLGQGATTKSLTLIPYGKILA